MRGVKRQRVLDWVHVAQAVVCFRAGEASLAFAVLVHTAWAIALFAGSPVFMLAILLMVSDMALSSVYVQQHLALHRYDADFAGAQGLHSAEALAAAFGALRGAARTVGAALFAAERSRTFYICFALSAWAATNWAAKWGGGWSLVPLWLAMGIPPLSCTAPVREHGARVAVALRRVGAALVALSSDSGDVIATAPAPSGGDAAADAEALKDLEVSGHSAGEPTAQSTAHEDASAAGAGAMGRGWSLLDESAASDALGTPTAARGWSLLQETPSTTAVAGGQSKGLGGLRHRGAGSTAGTDSPAAADPVAASTPAGCAGEDARPRSPLAEESFVVVPNKED